MSKPRPSAGLPLACQLGAFAFASQSEKLFPQGVIGNPWWMAGEQPLAKGPGETVQARKNEKGNPSQAFWRPEDSPDSSHGKPSACNVGTGLDSWGQEDPLEKGLAYPLQYPYLRQPMDGGAWWATAHRATESPTGLTGGQKSKVKASAGLLSPDVSLLGLQMAPDRCGHTRSVWRLVCVLISSYKDTGPTGLGPTHMTST
ncbi:uncharacterized protein LOC122424884 [Cervus canadensis]|uniref:uncharacterized protein LOC122424884 n=1 Tax=Cervus canadensis TaxID=1574408 RepID=UPI001CA36FC8|nr:uncharacterized protein LOC122424884 [Cervus canadensis]